MLSLVKSTWKLRRNKKPKLCVIVLKCSGHVNENQWLHTRVPTEDSLSMHVLIIFTSKAALINSFKLTRDPMSCNVNRVTPS